MAQIKIVFLMHDVDNFNGEETDNYDEKTADGFMYRLTGTPNQGDGNGTAAVAETKEILCDRLIPGSDNAKAAFDTKVHADVDAAKSAMGVANVDVSDASSSAWALSGDGTELSLTCDFSSNADADSFQTKFVARDPWATQGLVWQDKSKGVWNRDE